MSEQPVLIQRLDSLETLIATRFDAAATLSETHRTAHASEHENHLLTHQREREADEDRLAEVAIAANKANEWRGTMDDRERVMAKKEEVAAEFRAVRDAQKILKDDIDRRFDEAERLRALRDQAIDLRLGNIEKLIANWTGKMAVVTVLLLILLGPIAALAVKSLADGTP